MLSRRRAVRVALILAVVIAAAVPARAQTDRGTITGVVVDSSGGLVAGASVKAVHIGTNFERAVATSPQGTYTIPQLPVGVYVVVITATGFRTTTLENIEVTAGGSVRVDGTLAVGGLQDAVTVTADSRQIQTDSVKVTTAISSKFIQDLPLVVGGQLRSPLDLSLIAPEAKAGSSGDGGRGNIVIGGGQEGGWDLTVDGVSATPGAPFEQRLWTTLNSPSVEAINEFAVDTNGFKAEFGHAGGGAVSFVSRSGSNNWRGKAFEFYRDEKLDANNYFNKAAGRSKPPLEQHDFGGVFGGPVLIPGLYNGRNKSFFFSSYEAYRNKSSAAPIVTTIPTAGMYQRRLLELAGRQRQPDPPLRSGDDTRESEWSGLRARSVSEQPDSALALQPDIEKRARAGDDAAGSGRVCATTSPTRRAPRSIPTPGTSSASSSITTSRARIGSDSCSTGARCSSFRRRTAPAAGSRCPSTTSATRIRTPASTG